MIATHVIDSKAYISSYELYVALGTALLYHLWVYREISDNIAIEEGADYFLRALPIKKPGKAGRPHKNYMISITIAKYLCIKSKCIRGKKVRRFIEENFEKVAA